MKMAIDFIKMMQQEQKNTKDDKQVKKEENVAEAKPVAPKQDKKIYSKTSNSNKPKAATAENGYVYPFSLYTEGHIVDISSYGFEDGKTYTDKQISQIMLDHRHYEFAGEMTYKMFEEDNTLVATAKQYKKG